VIGALFATAISAGGVDVQAQLRACQPRTEAAAVRCMDRVLPADSLRPIPRGRYTYASDLWIEDQIEAAWFTSDAPPATPLTRHVARFADEDGAWRRSPGRVMLETYWLWKNGCLLDFSGRAAHARVSKARDDEWDLATAREQAALGPDVHATFLKAADTLSAESYTPKCDVEVIP
jgi:hypothetical protein